MNTGLPGTGIGGLFYLLSVIVMIGIELKDILIGKKNGDRKKLVVEQATIAISLFISIFATNIFFSKYIFKKSPVSLSSSPGIGERLSYWIQNYPIIVPIFLLTIVLLFTQTMYLILKTTKKN